MDFVPGTEIAKPVVQLVGEDGNAFSIVGRARKALRRAGVPLSVVEEYSTKAMSGDYNVLLATTMEYTTENEDESLCPDCGESCCECEIED